MSELVDIIYTRRAVRKYKDTEVERRTIEQLIDAGRMAPSAMNAQPWKFYVVTDRQLINSMDEQICIVVKEIYSSPHLAEFMAKENPIFHGAPAVIFVSAPRVNEWAALDIGMCAQNIMLAAKAAGLDTCPIGFGKFIERTSLYSQLEIPSSDNVLLSLSLGYGDEKPLMHERKKNNVFYVRPGVTATAGIRLE